MATATTATTADSGLPLVPLLDDQSTSLQSAAVAAPPAPSPDPAAPPQSTTTTTAAATTHGGPDVADAKHGSKTETAPEPVPANEITTAGIAPLPLTADPPVKSNEGTATSSNGAAAAAAGEDDGVNPLDFQGSVDSNNELPSAATLAKIANYVVLDRDGKSHTFRSLYTGTHAARRVLLIFVRHFFCGQCQEYLRTLSASITPDALLRLPVSTFIAVIGCGDPALIDMYAAETGCPFPIYADPTRKLYDELGMIRTLALGPKPAYIRKSLIKSSVASIVQGLKQLRNGLATKAGDARQIGGEFLFEPVAGVLQSPGVVGTGGSGSGAGGGSGDEGGHGHRHSDTSLDGKNDGHGGEEKIVTWCHRMKTTRDHAEIPELMEVLGLDGQGMPIKDKKRWSRALEQRKGTGLSQMSAMKKEAGAGAGTGASSSS
ncbi:AhpC/TSA antioxidant enzyme-domain-containing protein [Bombardia bombarda]|uniref:AhpC/TSA antioxidant enzyme-domain-containing protein n=1 Tax=Bombardia bombarda TaxID=252184 RepID=A0AA40CEZ9_9PEZI|nr:AhpC/TSA antioxidant enzyme-domain-containing protein [Bombardia bombarda]